MRDSSPRILMYNLIKDEISNLTVDTTSITSLDNNRYVLNGFYGFSIMSEREDIEFQLFCPDVGYSFVKLLNIDENLSTLLYLDSKTFNCNVILRDMFTHKEHKLIEKGCLVKYLNERNSIIYTKEVTDVIDKSKGLREKYDVLYLYDIYNEIETELYRYDKIRWFDITQYGDNIILWTEKEQQQTRPDVDLEKYREDPSIFKKYMEKYYKEMNKLLNEPRDSIIKLDISKNDSSPEILFKGDIEEIYHSQSLKLLLSPEENKLLFGWIEKIDKESLARTSKDIEHISIINLNDDELKDLPYSNIKYPEWSPDNEKLAFITTNEYTDESYLCIYDTYNQTSVGWYELKSGNTDSDTRLYPSQLSWSPIGNYIAFSTLDEHYDNFEEFYNIHRYENPCLHIIDVYNEKLSSINEVGGLDITWLNSSQMIYDRNGHLFMYDLINSEENIVIPGSGSIIDFDDDGGLIFKVENLDERYPQIWIVDINNFVYEPYLEDVSNIMEETITVDNFARIPSPDGDKVAVLKDGELILWNEDGSNPVMLCERHATKPVWSPSGEMLAWIRENDREDYYYPWTDIWIANRDGSGIEVVVEAMTNYNQNIYEDK